MKNDAKKNYCKRITIFLVIILFCNFLLPIFTYAKDDENATENHLTNFFCAVGDVFISVLQGQIVGNSAIKYTGDTEYSIKYSPGIIFSGTLAAFDINFISPIENQDKYIVKEPETVIEARNTVLKATSSTNNNQTEVLYYTGDHEYDSTKTNFELKQYTPGEDLIRESDTITYMQKLQQKYGFSEETTKEKLEVEDMTFKEEPNVYSWWLIGEEKRIEKYVLYASYNVKSIEENGSNSLVRIYEVKLTKTVLEKEAAVVSIAKVMRNTIASWYKVMQEIALVGLLCILVYIGIRGIISASTEDKAKYKKMLFDWLVAMVIIFILHYIISFTLTATKAISDVFSVNIIGEDGRDIIFSKLRTEVGESDFINNFFKTVMYYCLIILTVKFTIQYFKRVVYMGFLTMIAPIIALTYPLDKIKDGQAQAFSLWIKEFVFNALLQPLHLIIYYIFIGSSVMGTFAENNPFYALVVMAFLPQAEKMLRKMFGFDKAGNLGNLEAAFGGATVMNMINKLGSKGPKGKSGGGGSSENPSGENKVRMANEGAGDPYEALRNNTSNGRETTAQAMLDVYDEGFGTEDYDPAEREAMAREAYQPEGMNPTEEQFRAILQETGYEEDEIEEMIANDPRYANNGTASSENIPTGETSTGETSAEEAPMRGTPTGGMPTGGASARGTSAGRTTTGGTSARGASARGTSARGTSAGETSAEEAPMRGTPTGGMPTGGASARGTSAGRTTTGEAPMRGMPTGGAPTGEASARGTSARGTSAGRTTTGGTSARGASARGTSARGTSAGGTGRTTNNEVSRKDGAILVGKKIVKGVAKGAVKGTLRLTGIATLGTIGLAAGIATGEIENAFAGVAGGIAAGNRLGKGVANSATNATRRVASARSGIRETYEIGKYGEREAQIRKKSREFKKTESYKKLLNKFPGSEEKIDRFLNAGITDASKIRIALNNANNYSTDNAIAYMNMAKLCPDDIFEDRDKFNNYLESHGISKNKANEIYRAVREFK